jgi:hypothetical protein
MNLENLSSCKVEQLKMLSKVREQVLCSFEHHIQNSNLIFGSGD